MREWVKLMEVGPAADDSAFPLWLISEESWNIWNRFQWNPIELSQRRIRTRKALAGMFGIASNRIHSQQCREMAASWRVWTGKNPNDGHCSTHLTRVRTPSWCTLLGWPGNNNWARTSYKYMLKLTITVVRWPMSMWPVVQMDGHIESNERGIREKV